MDSNEINEIEIMTPTDEKTMSIFSSVVIGEFSNSIIPEIYSIFGMDAIKFIEIFSGMTIQVPLKEQIKDCVMKSMIYRLFTADKFSIEEIAKRFNLSNQRVIKILEYVNKQVETFPFEVTKR